MQPDAPTKNANQLPDAPPEPPMRTGQDVRLAARANSCTVTSGLAPGYVQTNLVVLPSRYAADFRLLCQRNPVPCPLVGESTALGSFDTFKSYLPGVGSKDMLRNVDIRRDAPRYNVYYDGKIKKDRCTDIVEDWTDDHVAFLIGCSFSFETALTAAGLPPRHTVLGRNVAMYGTTLPLLPAGVFTGGTAVVSMRVYPASQIEKVRDITRAYATMHGEPLAWGWDAVERLGIKDIDVPEWGDAPLGISGQPLGQSLGSQDEVPVFWGCGVTPQDAVMRASLKGTVMAHAPGCMVLMDVHDSDVVTAL